MTIQDQKYNGWTNYATWRVHLEIFDGADGAYDGSDASALRELVEEIIEDQAPEGLARDYAMAFLSDVNWHEIAEHLMPEDDGQDDDATVEAEA